MIEIYEFLPSDLLNFTPRNTVSNEYINAICTNPNHKAFTLKHKERIVALCSYVEIKDGVALASFIPSLFIASYQRRIVRVLVKLLAYAKKDLKLFRVQMTVEEGFAKARRFAEVLGFEKEGLLKKYNRKGQNFWLYARIL